MGLIVSIFGSMFGVFAGGVIVVWAVVCGVFARILMHYGRSARFWSLTVYVVGLALAGSQILPEIEQFWTSGGDRTGEIANELFKEISGMFVIPAILIGGLVVWLFTFVGARRLEAPKDDEAAGTNVAD
jgi:hypothetical protein